MTYCSMATVLALVGLTKKRFGHYACLKIQITKKGQSFCVTTSETGLYPCIDTEQRNIYGSIFFF